LSCRQIIAIIASCGIKRATPKAINWADMTASPRLKERRDKHGDLPRPAMCVSPRFGRRRGERAGGESSLGDPISQAPRGSLLAAHHLSQLSSSLSQPSQGPCRLSISNPFATALILAAPKTKARSAPGQSSRYGRR
jgi:hypothetical protein